MSAAAVLVMRVKRVFTYLRERGALSPESGVPESEVPYSRKWYFRRLVKQGVVRRHEGNCYLDEAAAQQYLWNLRIRAAIFLVAVVLLYLAYTMLK